MLNASSSSNYNPASALFAHPNGIQRSASLTHPPTGISNNGTGTGHAQSISEGNGEGEHEVAAAGDLRRSRTTRTPGTYGTSGLGVRREMATLSSFGAAGSALTSPALSAGSHYTPPAASRHPLFSHHAAPPFSASPSRETSPSLLSDPGPSSPPSPVGSVSSGAFSPASAFLSHFSSSSSLRPPVVNVAPDAHGARVLDYTLGKVVGRGGFSSVRLATHILTGEIFACKIVKRDDLSDRSGSLEKFEDEIRVWQTLPRHPALLPLLEMHRTAFATFLITPFLPGGSMLDVLRREGGSQNTARTWFPGIVAAVDVLHEGTAGFDGGILHGDLKLDNFLVDQSGKVMVCDFYMAQKVDKDGLGRVPPPFVTKQSTLPAHLGRGPRKSSPFPQAKKHHSHAASIGGERITDAANLPNQAFPSASLPYAPPELLRAPPSGPSLPQDIWALGIILYALLTGKLPFADAFDPRLQMKILRGTYEQPGELGREWSECLRGCLDGNINSRWDIKRLRESDAVIGWREVKRRSKSRSRSRARQHPSYSAVGGELFEPRRRRNGVEPANPVPIYSPRHTHTLSGEAHRDDSAKGRTFPVDGGLDPFVLASEARSKSASRSKSRGREAPPYGLFNLSPDLSKVEEDPLSAAMDETSISRGRSTVKRSNLVEGLSYARQSGTLSINTTPVYSTPAVIQSAPGYINSPIRRHEPSTSSSRSRSSRGSSSTSPSAPKSRSRSRTSPSWEPDNGTLQKWDYRPESLGRLDVVDEEGRRKDEWPGRGRFGRSRSRGREG